MNATVFDVKRFAVHDGPGIRTTIFFKGCPLHCSWCHNPEGIRFQPEIQLAIRKCVGCGTCTQLCPSDAHSFDVGMHCFDRARCSACGKCAEYCTEEALILCGKTVSVEQVMQTVLLDQAFYIQSGGGMTLSGGECLCQADFCTELLQTAKKYRIHTAVDTSGYVPQDTLKKIIPFTDIFLYDIKHIDSEKHKAYTGVSNQLILNNLAYLNGQGKTIEIRFPVIPTVNDDPATIHAIGVFLSQFSCIQAVRILSYNNLAGSKYEMLGRINSMPQVPPPDESQMTTIQAILKSYGLKVIR